MADKKSNVIFLFKGIDQVTGPLRKVNKQLSEIQAPVKKFQGQLQSFGKLSGFTPLKSAIGDVSSSLSNLARVSIGVGATIAGSLFAAGYAFDSFIGKTIAGNAGLADTSKKLGLSVESLQMWQFAAEQSGASAEDMNTAFLKFSKNISQARRGTGELVSLLGQDSTFLAKLNSFKSTEDAFDFFLRTLGKVPNEANQVALAMAGLGKSGANLIQLAELSDEERKKLFLQRKEIGLLSAEQAEGFKNTDDAMKALGVRLSFLKTEFVAAFLPAIQEIIPKLEKFIRDNREKILEFGRTIAEKLPRAFERVMLAVEKIEAKFKEWYPAIKQVWDAIGGLEGALKIIAGLIGLQIIAAIGGLISSIIILSGVLVSTPLGWVILGFMGLVGVAYLLQRAWKKLGPAISGAFSSIVEWIKKTVPFGKQLVTVFESIMSVLKWIFEHSPLFFALRAALAVGGVISGTQDALSGQAIAGQASPILSNATLKASAPVPSKGAENFARLLVDFSGVPRGTRVSTKEDDGKILDYSLGYAMGE